MSQLNSAIRSLLKAPGFTVVAVLTIAVGIGANTALFSVFDRLVLRPVTIPYPASLVAIWSSNPAVNFNAPAVSWPRFEELRSQVTSFSSMGISAFDNFTLTGNGDPAQLSGLRVSYGFFPTLGVGPVRGRNFTAEEDVPNGPAVCIISHDLWQTRFGRRENVVGENIQLNGQPWEVIGILAPQLTNPFSQVQVFVPRVFEVSGLTPQQIQVGAGYAQPIARLKPDVSLEQAKAELAAISRSYGQQFATRLDATSTSEPKFFVDTLVSNLKPTFYTLLGAVCFVLLIACANIASLFLGRLTARQKEIAVRQSLGASRRAIVGQFLTESLLFSTAAGALGTLLGMWALAAIQSIINSQPGSYTVLSLDWRALVFTAGVTILSALLVGLVPAWQASKSHVVDVLKDSSRGSSGAKGGRFRAVLIVVEVALSVVLLVGSSLLSLTFLKLQRTPPGFDPKGVAGALVNIPATRYKTAAEQVEFFTQVLERLRAHPQVKEVATALGLPLSNFGARAPYSVTGRPILPLPQRPLAGLQIVSDDYFKLMRIPIREGRSFAVQDRAGAPGACIVNESLAKRLFPNESALGHVLLRGRDADIGHEIVGVIADVKSNGINAPVPDEIYYPMRQLNRSGFSVLARTEADPMALQTIIRSAVAAVDKEQPISFFQTLESSLAQSLGVQRIIASLTAIFACLALVLAVIGLYSVLAYAVTQRTPEIGIRMALGAQRSQVVALVMASGMKLVAIGLVAGLAFAALVAWLIQALLFNVQPLDPLVYAAVATTFAIVSALACLLPSLRASQIDPLVALRTE